MRDLFSTTEIRSRYSFFYFKFSVCNKLTIAYLIINIILDDNSNDVPYWICRRNNVLIGHVRHFESAFFKIFVTWHAECPDLEYIGTCLRYSKKVTCEHPGNLFHKI